MVWLSFSKTKVKMIEGRIEIKADDLSQKIVEVLDVEGKVDVV